MSASVKLSGTASANCQFTIWAPRMPSTMVIWLSDTSRPRASPGDTSAMYIGERAEATPMPMPPTKRAMLNNTKSLKIPVAMADTVKRMAAITKRGLRPYLSDKAPATIAPIKQPTRAVDMATPCITGDWLMPKYSS